jgi:hypothetical protein
VRLRRLSALSRDHELLGHDGQRLAEVRLRAFREAGEVLAADGRRWTVERAPNFGPWNVSDERGTTVVTVTKEGLRERFSVTWPTGGLLLTRRAALGRRLMDVVDAASGEKVGDISQQGRVARTFDLDLPVTPDEVLGAIAWVLAMLAQRDAAVAAQH